MSFKNCPQEDTVYLYVYREYVDFVEGFCRVGDRILSGRLTVEPTGFWATTTEKAIDTQIRFGQLGLNDMHGFDWECNYELDNLKLDYPVVITEMN